MVRLPARRTNGEPYDVASGQLFVQFMCLPGAYTGASLPRRLQNCFQNIGFMKRRAGTHDSVGRSYYDSCSGVVPLV